MRIYNWIALGLVTAATGGLFAHGVGGGGGGFRPPAGGAGGGGGFRPGGDGGRPAVTADSGQVATAAGCQNTR